MHLDWNWNKYVNKNKYFRLLTCLSSLSGINVISVHIVAIASTSWTAINSVTRKNPWSVRCVHTPARERLNCAAICSSSTPQMQIHNLLFTSASFALTQQSTGKPCIATRTAGTPRHACSAAHSATTPHLATPASSCTKEIPWICARRCGMAWEICRERKRAKLCGFDAQLFLQNHRTSDFKFRI